MKSALQNTFGLDLSDAALTAVEMVWDRRGVKVVNYSRVELEPETVEDDSIIVNPEGFKEALAKLLKEGKNGPIVSRNVIIALPEEKTFAHQVGLSAGSVQDESAILLAAKNYIPIELGDAVVDYRVLEGVTGGGVITYNVVATQMNLVESLIIQLGEAGLNVVAVDVSKDSLFRCCLGFPTKPEKGFAGTDRMVVSIERDVTFFNVRTASGETFTINSAIGGMRLVEQIKKGLRIATTSEAKQVLRTSEQPTAQRFDAIRDVIQTELGMLAQRALELKHIVESQTRLVLEKIHVVGTYPCIPGFVETIQKAFPGIEVVQGISGMGVPENSCDFAKAIGLALRAVMPGAHEKGVNLLPRSRKEELNSAEWRPKIMLALLAVCAIFMGLAGLSGYFMGSSILGVKIAQQDLKVSRDRIENPYLNKLAQASQQKSLLEGEMLTILQDALPMSYLMAKMDGYNVNGVGLVNVTYYLDSAKALVVRLRGKSDSRESTEKFVLGLEKEPYFSNIISPLSNLVGKGERFINVDMNVVPEPIMADYEKSQMKEVAEDEGVPANDGQAMPKLPGGASEGAGPEDGLSDGTTSPNSGNALEVPKANP